MIEILNEGKAKVIYEPRGEYDGLEGFQLKDIINFQLCQKENKSKYYRVSNETWTDGYYETCGVSVFNKCFKILS